MEVLSAKNFELWAPLISVVDVKGIAKQMSNLKHAPKLEVTQFHSCVKFSVVLASTARDELVDLTAKVLYTRSLNDR